MAVVQEAALAEAQNRIRQLQFQLQQAHQQAQRGASGGFLSNLFGGNRAQQKCVAASRLGSTAGRAWLLSAAISPQPGFWAAGRLSARL